MLKLETSLNNCLKSETFKDVNVVSVKIHCSFLAKQNRYSVGKTILTTNDANDPTKRIIEIFKELIATKDIPDEPTEAHWDIFLKTKENRFMWFRKEDGNVENEGFRCDPYDSDKTEQQYMSGVHRNSTHQKPNTQPKETTSKLGHYEKDKFLEYYSRLAPGLQSVFKGREVLDLLDEKNEFLSVDGLQVNAVKKEVVYSLKFENA